MPVLAHFCEKWQIDALSAPESAVWIIALPFDNHDIIWLLGGPLKAFNKLLESPNCV